MTVESNEAEVATSENAESSETPGEGNLTMAELASNLLKNKTKEEPPEPTEEELESPEQAGVEEESEEQSVEEQGESEQTEPPAEPSDVLSKYNIDLDSLSEDETKELAKSLHLSAVKRFGDLTAQKNALAQQNAQLQEQAQKQEQASQSENPEFLKDNALANVNDVNSLKQEVENFNALVEWADEGLENEVEYDDSGNESLV